ncbi:unnamed protein product [Amoebophrya sp. A120]|nr:unnamed protein product [Amoebophrya sp. A120]|eukprot:GSA120T00019123001.1
MDSSRFYLVTALLLKFTRSICVLFSLAASAVLPRIRAATLVLSPDCSRQLSQDTLRDCVDWEAGKDLLQPGSGRLVCTCGGIVHSDREADGRPAFPPVFIASTEGAGSTEQDGRVQLVKNTPPPTSAGSATSAAMLERLQKLETMLNLREYLIERKHGKESREQGPSNSNINGTINRLLDKKRCGWPDACQSAFYLKDLALELMERHPDGKDAQLGVLELGVLGGSSSVFFVGMYRKVYFVDVYREHLETVRNVLEELKRDEFLSSVFTNENPERTTTTSISLALAAVSFHHFDLYAESWRRNFGQFYPEGVAADVAVVDADHRYRNVLMDLDNLFRIPQLHYIALHDFGVSVDVHRAVLEVQAEGKMECRKVDSAGSMSTNTIGVMLEQNCHWFGRDAALWQEGIFCQVHRERSQLRDRHVGLSRRTSSRDSIFTEPHTEEGTFLDDGVGEDYNAEQNHAGQIVVTSKVDGDVDSSERSVSNGEEPTNISPRFSGQELSVPSLSAFQQVPAYGVAANFVREGVRVRTNNGVYVHGRDVQRLYQTAVNDLVRRLVLLFSGYWLHGTTVWRNQVLVNAGHRREFLLLLKPFRGTEEATPEVTQLYSQRAQVLSQGVSEEEQYRVLNPGPTQFCFDFDPEPFRDYFHTVGKEIADVERRAATEFLQKNLRGAPPEVDAEKSKSSGDGILNEEEEAEALFANVRDVLFRSNQQGPQGENAEKNGMGGSFPPSSELEAFTNTRLKRKLGHRIPDFSQISTQPFSVHLLDVSLCPELYNNEGGEDENILNGAKKDETSGRSAPNLDALLEKVLYEHPSRCRYDLLQVSPASGNTTEAARNYRFHDFWTHAWKFVFAKPGALAEQVKLTAEEARVPGARVNTKNVAQYLEPGWELLPSEHWGKLYLQKVGRTGVSGETVHLVKKRDILTTTLALDYFSQL